MDQAVPGGSKPHSMRPPMPAPSPSPLGLSRYGSAPGAFLAELADAVIAGGELTAAAVTANAVDPENMMYRYFSGESPCLTSESSCRATGRGLDPDSGSAVVCLKESYGSSGEPVDANASAGGGYSLVRHSSSPAGFFSHVLSDQGISTTRAIENYPQTSTEGIHVLPNRRLRSQWSLSRQESLSAISELSIPEIGEVVTCCNSSNEASGHPAQTYVSGNFQLGSWDDKNSFAFAASPSKRAKTKDGDILTSLNHSNSQFRLPRSSSELSALEKYFEVQQDSAPCRVRAKRGCATHPRSIAERERRTRISKRLRNLQELVPNMDKQTSTSDMLELAIQHIKELQSQIQKLKQEQANCTCPKKQERA